MGRVVSCKEDEKSFVLNDGLSECNLKTDKNIYQLKPGDFVKVYVKKNNHTMHLVHMDIFQTKPFFQDFPQVQGDFYRIQKNNQHRAKILSIRSDILRLIRNFFYAENFIEIESPLLVPSPGLEVHLEGLKIENQPYYLITSPEYQLKRLLSGGLQKIYSLGKVFRGDETGNMHNPEFTMLEWYRAFSNWSELVQDVESICFKLAQFIHGTPQVMIDNKIYDLTPPWPQLSVSQAFKDYANIDLTGAESVQELSQKIAVQGFDVPNGSIFWSDLFFSVFVNEIEPKLAEYKTGDFFRPVVLHDWPLPLCALAQKKPENSNFVERFEAYIGGIELCNGFGELTNADEQKQRLLKDIQERKQRGLPVYPIDEKFLLALKEGIPHSSGVAMGVDRLIMLLLGVSTIEDVLPFSIKEV